MANVGVNELGHTCNWFGSKPSPEPIVICEWEPYGQILKKFDRKHKPIPSKIIWKYLLNVRRFVQA